MDAALAPGAHTAIIDGLEQRYHVAGRGPLCIAHSGGPGVGWEYLRMPAVEEHLTLVYVEPIGTGASGRLDDPRAYTLERYVRFAQELIEPLGKVFFLGHSYGGFVAQRLALAQPERLAGLILYSTAPATGAEFWAELACGLDRFAERHGARPEAADAVAAFELAKGRPADGMTDDETTAVFRRMFPAYFADYWRHEAEFAPLRAAVRLHADPLRGEDPTPFDVRGELGALALPTLVIAGRHDPICPPRWAQQLHAGIAGSQLAVFEDSGHFAHLEEPRAFARAIAGFVQPAKRAPELIA